MKKIFTFFFWLGFALVGFSQTSKVNPNSCYEINNKDTTWEMMCVDTMPAFPNGDDAMFDFLKKNVKYPQLPKEMGIQGKSFISFVVDTTGNMTNVLLFKGVSVYESGTKAKEAAKQLDEEALRVIQLMPNWSPGLKNGKPVKVKYIIPIMYTIR